MSRLKSSRSQQVVDLTLQLLGYDLWNATYWMDVRKAQNPSRNFGNAATAVWTAFRKVLPWQEEPAARPEIPYGIIAHRFIQSTPATKFYTTSPAMPASGAANPCGAVTCTCSMTAAADSKSTVLVHRNDHDRLGGQVKRQLPPL